ncbi:MAG: class I SAM-dependent methyltransferase [Candidatus Eisenbacteria bacterium]
MSGSADYYAANLSAERLRKCYALASPRVRQYLSSEVEYAASCLSPGDAALELGCGYGRVTLELAKAAGRVVGIDTSAESIALARTLVEPGGNCEFLEMDAAELAFVDGRFDAVVCVQNGICAFGVDPPRLVREALRVTRAGGRALFSTYASAFWPHRLEWFEAQAEAGLVGELDRGRTGDGTIVCADGLRLGTLTPAALREVGSEIGLEPLIVEVDGSSVFAVWTAPAPASAHRP